MYWHLDLHSVFTSTRASASDAVSPRFDGDDILKHGTAQLIKSTEIDSQKVLRSGEFQRRKRDAF